MRDPVFLLQENIMSTSIMSFPDRGPWGNSAWRGNASGYVYKSLFEQLKPRVFIDPMVGSGTSVEVAKEFGIEAFGLDLHSGFNALRSDILTTVGKHADLCVSHPPYGSMVLYSGEQWGEPHPDDLSRCVDDADFHEKLQLVLLNQRRATLPGGYYGTLIGDWRRNGVYTSYQAEAIARMPSDELAAVLIKAQHNCVSDSRKYAKMTMPRIMHEYLILWRKKSEPVLVFFSKLLNEQAARVQSTWKNMVLMVMRALGGECSLDRIYAAVANQAPERLANNQHWKAKVRQVLNSNPQLFASSKTGHWALAA